MIKMILFEWILEKPFVILAILIIALVGLFTFAFVVEAKQEYWCQERGYNNLVSISGDVYCISITDESVRGIPVYLK